VSCTHCHQIQWLSFVFILLGLSLCLVPQLIGVIIGYVIGILLLIFGVWRLLIHLRYQQTDSHFSSTATLSIVLICLGIFTVLRPTVVLSVLPLVLGVLLLLIGLLAVRKVWHLKRLFRRRWRFLLLPACLILVSGLLLVIHPFSEIVTIRLTGLCLLIQGFMEIWTHSCFCRAK